jgi:putative Mg2+ transporter-C (MgtC) family protein
MIRTLGYDARLVGIEHDAIGNRFVFCFQIRWKQPDADQPSTDVLGVVAEHCTVERFEVIGEKPM